jgi:hypothetical protein
MRECVYDAHPCTSTETTSYEYMLSDRSHQTMMRAGRTLTAIEACAESIQRPLTGEGNSRKETLMAVQDYQRLPPCGQQQQALPHSNLERCGVCVVRRLFESISGMAPSVIGIELHQIIVKRVTHYSQQAQSNVSERYHRTLKRRSLKPTCKVSRILQK